MRVEVGGACCQNLGYFMHAPDSKPPLHKKTAHSHVLQVNDLDCKLLTSLIVNPDWMMH
jgi:hypothetical protein